jgi:hypothetical protein
VARVEECHVAFVQACGSRGRLASLIRSKQVHACGLVPAVCGHRRCIHVGVHMVERHITLGVADVWLVGGLLASF